MIMDKNDFLYFNGLAWRLGSMDGISNGTGDGMVHHSPACVL
jgi:hypothetical protein